VNGTGPAVSAVVVNYRAAQLTVECVASLRADGVEEIVVVDSGSGDDCEQLLAAADPAALFVSLVQNVGYGAAANAGVRRTGAPVVLVANPDLVVAPGTVAALAGVLAADARVGVVGPRIDRPDGTRYPSARTFPSLTDAVGHGFAGLVTTENRWSRRYLRTEAEDAGPVDWVSGAFFAARRQAWDHVGGFDEDYFMFMEDVDLCWRLRRAGWRVAYEPGGTVVHVHGVSTARHPYRMIVAHHRSLLRFASQRWHGWRRVLLVPAALFLGLRAAANIVGQAFRTRAKRGG
jgi:N-acetylglucosaminyl-diphospho-decaprenol L-rhamnosyltransferase